MVNVIISIVSMRVEFSAQVICVSDSLRETEMFIYVVFNTLYVSEDIFSHKHVEENGDIIEMHIWKVPKSSSCPEGVAYSLVCVRKGRRLIGYDNENHGTGISNHHKHVGERIVPYAFVDEWKLVEDFSKELDRIRRG